MDPHDRSVSPDQPLSSGSSSESLARKTSRKSVQFSSEELSPFYGEELKQSESAVYTDDEGSEVSDSTDDLPRGESELAEIQRLRKSLKKFKIAGTRTTESGEEPPPEFNKRPLSDTPTVSGANTPSTLSPMVLSDEEISGDENSASAEEKRALKRQTEENTIRNRDLGEVSGTTVSAVLPPKRSANQEEPQPEPQPEPQSVHRNSRHHHEREFSGAFSFPGQSKKLGTTEENAISLNERLVVVMVGLPARGKSYLSKKLVRYLNWLQIPSKIFNVGATRRARSRQSGPEKGPLPDGDHQSAGIAQDANFFSPTNEKSVQMREEWARETLDVMLDYLLNRGGCVGVFDATNTTIKRRHMLFETIKQQSHGKLKVLYLESVCNDAGIIDENIRLKLDGPDYKNMDRDAALADFKGRLQNYEKVYEPICDSEETNRDFQYIKMVDVGRKVIACNIKGFIPSQIIYYFLNFNLSKRLTFVARHGESTDNVRGRIGGNAPLTPRGRRFSRALVRFVEFKKREFRIQQLEEYEEKLKDPYYKAVVDSGELVLPEEPHLHIISSMMRRAVQTADYFPADKYDIKQLRALDELGSGNFDGMTYQEIQDEHPDEFAARLNDKMSYRYPGMGGESYLDVINRLRPVINEMERSTHHQVIITHRVVTRILMAYFLNLKREAIGELDVPLHTVYVFEPQPFGVEWKLYEYDETTDWFKEVDAAKMESSKRVRQVGVSYRERQYSVVPTAPHHSSSGSSVSSFSVGGLRSSLKEYAKLHGLPDSSNSMVENLQRARGIPRGEE